MSNESQTAVFRVACCTSLGHIGSHFFCTLSRMLLTFAMLSRKLQIQAEGSGHEERHAMNGDTLVLETLGWFFYPCPEKGGRPVCKGVFDNHDSTNPWLIELGESVFRCSFSRWVPQLFVNLCFWPTYLCCLLCLL